MKILLSTDGSACAQAAIDVLLRLPLPPGVEVILLNVIEKEFLYKSADKNGLSDEQHELLAQTRQLLQEEAEGFLAAAAVRLEAGGLHCLTRIASGHPAREIMRAAKKMEADLVIVGSHGWTGVKRFLLGSVSDQVLRHAPCSVLIARSGQADAAEAPAEEQPALRLLLAYDDSGPAKRALAFTSSLRLREQDELTILSVLPLITRYRQDIKQRLSWVWKEKKKHAEKALEQIRHQFKWSTSNLTTELREAEDVSHEILDMAAEKHCDLIILGDKGKGAVEKFLLGSVAPRIAHHALCSVLAVRKSNK